MTTLLLIHIVSFSLSLILLPALLIASVSKFAIPNVVRFSSLIATVTGLVSGCALLIASPSGAYCALLFGYVVVFGACYVRTGMLQPARAKATVSIDR